MKTHVLFVCLGNICRSPLAEIAFKAAVEAAGRGQEFEVDSAGTSGWHDGKMPDAGSIREAARRGLDIRYQRSRKLVVEDFARFQVIVGMDASNMAKIRALAPDASTAVVKMRDFDPVAPGGDVPDPWEKPDAAFAEVFDILERSMPGLLRYIDAL